MTIAAEIVQYLTMFIFSLYPERMLRADLGLACSIVAAMFLFGCVAGSVAEDKTVNSGPNGLDMPITSDQDLTDVASGVGARPMIADLQYGAVCGPKEDRVCGGAGDVQVTYESRCVYDQKVVACTWYGYSFDYNLPKGNVILRCATYRSFLADQGNPTAVLARKTQVHYYDVELLRDRHHFFNPQYTAVFSDADPRLLPSGIEHVVESCSYMGDKLFEFTLALHYPAH